MDSKQFLEEQYDRVYITSLFTFYYNQTVKTIQSYEKLISPEKIYIGGIMVSLMKDRIKNDIFKREVNMLYWKEIGELVHVNYFWIGH